MGILARKAVEGYGGGELMLVDGASKELKTLMVMGVASTETSMLFYNGAQTQDITKIPSDRAINNIGYGFMGINSSKTLSNYVSVDVVNNIKKQYSPSSKPANFYDASFAPWGVLMSAKHQHNDIKAYLTRASTKKLISDIADDWGIKANKEEFSSTVAFFIAQAHYHGAVVDDYEGYVNFYAALFHASSDNDSERSFSKWSIVDVDNANFSESAFRPSVVGADGKNSLHLVSTPASLKSSSKGTKIAVNGKELTEPVWKFLWSKYSDKKGMQVAWKLCQSYSARSGYISDRVLNFHYGFNSFVQASRIEKLLGSKIIISDFKGSIGKANAILDGVGTDEFLKSWYSKNSGNSKAIKHMDSLRSAWGSSSAMENQRSPANAQGYKDKAYSVPFYGQGKYYQETFGELLWHPNGGTFNRNGCMVYSHAYVASALTGKLINPAEMGSIMVATNTLVSVGVVGGSMPNVYTKLGLKAKVYGSGVSSMDTLLKEVESGGLAIVRVHAGLFTQSENHYIVITGMVKNEKGEKMYSIYTSSSVVQSKQLYKASTLKSNMHRDATVIRK